MKAHVTWALVGASVVLLGLASWRVTDAAWRASDTTSGETIRTGHLRITGSGDVNLDVSGLGKQNATTGDRVQIPLRVVNSSTTDVNYQLKGASVRAGETPPALDLRVARVADEAACPSPPVTGDLPGIQLYSGGITNAGTSPLSLARDASDVLCLTATFQTVTAGQSGHYVFTFQANQR